jgi:Mrp family chromosome partitioning ATPase/capsular polysaccharide biosynthesis protein
VEVGFIASALRRFWPVVVVTAVLGALPAWWLQRVEAPKYNATAVLLLRPPSESRSQVWSGDPDRYVIGQIGVLQSDGLAEGVATQVGGGLTRDDVLEAVTIAQRPATDLVDITARTVDPEQSVKIADAYVDLYFVAARAAVDESQRPDIERLDAELEVVQSQLDGVDAEIVRRMEPFLPDRTLGASQQFTVPGVDQVAPDLISQKETLLFQYSQLLTTKSDLELNARLRVTSEIVQRATAPETPTSPSFRLFSAAGGIAGLFAGFVLAILLARLSGKVGTADEAGDVLGQPLVGSMPHMRAIAQSPRTALEALPSRATVSIDELCVRAEAAATGTSLAVVVTGTERGSGSTTVAAAMANRFAAAGQRVLLVDADPRDPELTRVFAAGSPGVQALLALASGGRGDPFVPVAIPDVRVIGLGGNVSAGVLRRQDVPELVRIATEHAHAVVFDGGPLLDAATTVQLTQLCDAVVLTIPLERQRTSSLRAVARQLEGRRGELLPIATPARRRRRRPEPTSGTGQRRAPAVGLVDDVAVSAAPVSRR